MAGGPTGLAAFAFEHDENGVACGTWVEGLFANYDWLLQHVAFASDCLGREDMTSLVSRGCKGSQCIP